MMIEKQLLDLMEVKSTPCVSIIMNTHRNFPENDQDPITLKNMIGEAGDKLREMGYDNIDPILENMNMLQDKVDHNLNLDSMGLFFHDDQFTLIRLPVKVEERVIVDDNYATRDLWRRIQHSSGYYVLSLNQEKVRLLEANSGKLVRELKTDDFPMENDRFHAQERHKHTMAKGTDNQFREFFNRADKSLQKILHRRPMPVVLAGEERNRSYFHEVTDDKKLIVGTIGPWDKNQDARQIVEKAWKEVESHLQEKKNKAMEELAAAQNAQKAVSDILSIWRMARNGRADTVFVEKGFFQPARKDGEDWVLIEKTDEKDYAVDIVDEIIEEVLKNDGDVVFTDPGELSTYQGMAMIARY